MVTKKKIEERTIADVMEFLMQDEHLPDKDKALLLQTCEHDFFDEDKKRYVFEFTDGSSLYGDLEYSIMYSEGGK